MEMTDHSTDLFMNQNSNIILIMDMFHVRSLLC